MAATRESDTFAARLEALHAAGHVALSAPHGGKTMLPAHDRASEVVLDVTVTAIEGGEVHAEATRRGPHPAWPVAADTLAVETPSGGPPAGGVPALEEARAPEPPAEAATIGTVTIALLTALLLAIAVAAFFALRHTDPRRAE